MGTERNGTQISLFVESLKICARKKDYRKGIALHTDILERGLLKKGPYILSSLINMYAKCGMLARAQQVLEDLPVRDSASWSALISGYAQQGRIQEALCCSARMRIESLILNDVTLSCILKACGSTGAIDKGKQAHNEIVNRGLLEKNIVVGNALLDMYAKWGMLEKALEVLECLPIRDVVSWSTLIAGFVKQDQPHAALSCWAQMQREGLSPNDVTFAGVLKACGSLRDIDMGQKLHADILRRGLLQKNIILGNVLVGMYAKCGVLSKAVQVLKELPIRDVVSWSAVISGYVEQGQDQEALNYFEMMQQDGVTPNAVTYTCVLKACGSMGSADRGKQIHDEIVNDCFLQNNIVLGNALVDMYVKCGMHGNAQHVHEKLPFRDVVSWNTLIAGYVQHSQYDEAFKCFAVMRRQNFFPNQVTFICVLSACGNTRALAKGKEIHVEVTNRDLLEQTAVLSTALVDMYAKCGVFAEAQKLLEDWAIQDADTWNVLILGYSHHGLDHEALLCFKTMQQENIAPNEMTFIHLLKVCCSIGAVRNGIEVHDEMVSRGFLDKSIVLCNALVDMYVKCGVLERAQQVLEGLPVRDTISWNAIIVGYVKEARIEEALNCFRKLQKEGLAPDEITMTCILKACGTKGTIDQGEEMHHMIVAKGLLEKSLVLGTALVDMYAKCGVLTKAHQVLEELPVRDTVSWNAVLTGYVRHGQYYMALNCYTMMQKEGLYPDEVTYANALKAYGNTGAIDMAIKIHNEILYRGLLTKYVMLGTALVDMYVKCGMVSRAHRVVQELPFRDTFCWNALIAGYAEEQNSLRILECFEQMQREGVSPDDVTFLCVLNAYSHIGKLDEAQLFYENMSRKYGIIPKIEHHTCMVVMFGSVGNFGKALSVIKTMPSFNDPSVWLALLSTCRKWGNVKLGRLAFDHVIQVDNNLAVAYILMASIYAAADMSEDAADVEDMRIKNTGFSRCSPPVWMDDAAKRNSNVISAVFTDAFGETTLLRSRISQVDLYDSEAPWIFLR